MCDFNGCSEHVVLTNDQVAHCIKYSIRIFCEKCKQKDLKNKGITSKISCDNLGSEPIPVLLVTNLNYGKSWVMELKDAHILMEEIKDSDEEKITWNVTRTIMSKEQLQELPEFEGY